MNLYCAYSGVVDKEDAKRKEHAEKWAWWHNLVAWLKWFLWVLPFVCILLLVLWIRREFFQRDSVNVRMMEQQIPDKEARRALTQGTPYESVYKKIRAVFGLGGSKTPDKVSKDGNGGTGA